MRRNINEDVDLSFLTTPKEKTKFQKYNEEAEKILNQMEKCKVWTDILQVMQSFTKFIKSYKNFPVVPAKQTFMRRMAQALDPQIPSGVHNQVLELFVLLFERIGPNRLAEDLWCFTPGLFPLIRSGATDIRTKILDITKKHLLPIIKTIKDIQKAFVISVVVGMEENASGIKDKTVEIIDEIRKDDEKYFWSICWDILRSNSVSRKPLLVYMTLRLDCPLNENQVSNRELMFFAIINTLSDDKTLVLRDMLDILCTRIKLDSGMFEEEQFICIVERMLLLLSKKDSGLSRRVNFYLLGLNAKDQDVEKEQTISFFNSYSLRIIEKALNDLYEYSEKEGIGNVVIIYEELLGKQTIAEQIFKTVIYYVLSLLQKAQEKNKRSDVELIIEFLKNVDVDVLFEYIISLMTNEGKDYAVKRTISFISTYQGDEQQMKKLDDFSLEILLETWKKMERLINSGVQVQQLADCFDLIQLCIKDNFEETDEKVIQLLKITIQANKVFEMFIQNYIKNDTTIPAKKLGMFVKFCGVMRTLHAEITPFKKHKLISNEEGSNEDIEGDEEMGIEGIQMLMKKEIQSNGWIEELKKVISEHPHSVLKIKAAKCYYDIWKKEEREPFKLDDEEFIYCLYEVLWKSLNTENYTILTDVVLFFHTIGIVHPQLTFDFITEKLKDGNEEDIAGYMLFWKNSSVLVYDVENSVFNRALLLFLRFYIHQNHDPFFLDFLDVSMNSQTIDRIIPPILNILLMTTDERNEKKYGFEVTNQFITSLLNIVDTIFSCSNPKLISALQTIPIPPFLNEKYKKIDYSFEKMSEPNNILDLIIHAILLYLKGNKKLIVTENEPTALFHYQSLATDILINILTNYSENEHIKKLSVSLQYTSLLSFAESITVSPKLQLHLLSLVKTLVKTSDLSQPSECITRYSLFLQTLISGICQEKHMYRSHFLRMIEESISYIPVGEYKSSIVLLIQAISNVISQNSPSTSTSLCTLSEEINPILDIQKKIYEYSLTLFPYKSPFEDSGNNSQTQQVSAGQQIGNAVLFIPMLVVSVFSDVKGTKEKRNLDPHFLTATLRRTIQAIFELFEVATQINNSFVLQSNCVSLLEMLFTAFPIDFIGEYLLMFNSFPEKHSFIFRSFKPESIVKMLWSILVISQAGLYEDVLIQNIFEFVQFIITKVITPTELYRTQMYIQSIINYHLVYDEMIFSIIHTLKLFLDALSKIDTKTTNKLGNGWEELINSILNKYMALVQRWKDDGQPIRLRNRQKSVSLNPSVNSSLGVNAASSLDSKDSGRTNEDNSPMGIVNNSLYISSDLLNIVINDIIPIITMVFDENSIGNMIDLGKQFEYNLIHPGRDMGINVSSLNILNELAKRNQLNNKWVKIIMNAFGNDEFFNKQLNLLNQWKLPIFSIFSANNSKLLNDLINTMGKGLLGQGLLVNKENESISRAKVFKRVAFVIYSGENEAFDGFSDQNQPITEIILDKLIDSIKQYPSEAIYCSGFLLLRVMLLKCSFVKLKKKVPTILNELITLFNLPFDKEAMTILSGLQLYDMLQIIPECSVDVHSWIFLGPYIPDINSDNSKYQPLIPTLFLGGDGIESSVTPPDTSYGGLTQLRELTIKEKKLLDMQEYQLLRTKLSFYTKNLYFMTSRSDKIDMDLTISELLENFSEK